MSEKHEETERPHVPNPSEEPIHNPSQQSGGPVPLEQHYGVVKYVEDRIHRHLNDLEHEYFVVGLRVAYDELDSSNEPGVLPFSVEFGILGPVDVAARCTEGDELGEEELLEAARNSPIPLELLDELLDTSKKELESAAGTQLSVGVAVVLTGSPTLGYSADCPCNNRTRKRYCYYHKPSKTTRCYCTTRTCD